MSRYNNAQIEMRRKRARQRRRIRRTLKALTILLMVTIFLCLGKIVHRIVKASFDEENPSKKTIMDAKKESKSKKNKIADTKQNDENIDDIDNEWSLILVNQWNSLPDDFYVETKSIEHGHSVDIRVYSDLIKMLEDARSEGLDPIICSSFRTREKQENLYINQVRKHLRLGYSAEDAEKEAATWVATPGTSEHQTGLAVDIVARSYQMLDEAQENTAEQKWLMQNSHKYGFVLRYPSDKSNHTGISYEPWHYRYVGKEAAKEIYENNLCFEEYLESK